MEWKENASVLGSLVRSVVRPGVLVNTGPTGWGFIGSLYSSELSNKILVAHCMSPSHRVNTSWRSDTSTDGKQFCRNATPSVFTESRSSVEQLLSSLSEVVECLLGLGACLSTPRPSVCWSTLAEISRGCVSTVRMNPSSSVNIRSSWKTLCIQEKSLGCVHVHADLYSGLATCGWKQRFNFEKTKRVLFWDFARYCKNLLTAICVWSI